VQVAGSTPSEQAHRDRVVQRLVIAAIVCALVLGALTVFFVWTHTGQRLDRAALSGQKLVQRSRTAARSDELLRTISVGSLAVFGASLIAVALLRGRWHLGLGVAAVILGSNVTTQVYKAIVQRPEFLANDVIRFNTLPSGHSTVAASLAAALVLVVPHRMRALAATLGALYAAGIATMTLAAGWHRPSDAVCAFAVVGIWTFGTCAVLVRLRGTGRPREPEGLPGLVIGAITVLLIGFSVVLATTTINRADGIHIVRMGLAYLLAALSIVAVGVGFIVTEVLLLRGVSLDVPLRRRVDVDGR
jgi:membrane-associated phospholipid phosphatase